LYKTARTKIYLKKRLVEYCKKYCNIIAILT